MVHTAATMYENEQDKVAVLLFWWGVCASLLCKSRGKGDEAGWVFHREPPSGSSVAAPCNIHSLASLSAAGTLLPRHLRPIHRRLFVLVGPHFLTSHLLPHPIFLSPRRQYLASVVTVPVCMWVFLATSARLVGAA